MSTRILSRNALRLARKQTIRRTAIPAFRSLSYSLPRLNKNNGGGPGGGGGGFPMGNIFNQQPRKPGAALEEHGTDLTNLAKEGKLDPVIGRDEEIKRMIQILSRRTKNNPVLIGPAGVGKTAVVEGLAQRIIAGEVPESLKDRKLISIDLSSIVAGTGVRGTFEEKMRNLLKDISEAGNEVIIFIDEIHQLLSLGKAEGSLDAGNMLKPALARGLQLAGATTPDEFRKTIETDAALTRRFQPVSIDEPSVDATITILRGIKTKYELHHGVSVADSALVAAAVYSNRYITERHLPDKAIDLMDEASSALRLKRESKPEELEAVERSLTTLHIELTSLQNDSDPTSVERKETITSEISSLETRKKDLEDEWMAERRKEEDLTQAKEKLERAKWELEEAQRKGDYRRASELRYSTIPELEAKLTEDPKDTSVRVTSEDIAQVVAKTTGIPVTSLLSSDRARLLHLEDTLRARVIGQEPALHTVSEAIRLSRAGLSTSKRPIASFLFLGPTGVGKTELAKALATETTGSEKGLVTVNMSEYSERHNISRLIGAPPGYVGYESAGQLTEAVRRKPYSIVLLDEFEKAYRPDVANLFLQVLDEGTLTDGQGRKVDFKNTILILTSNIGSDILTEKGAMDPDGKVTEQAKVRVLERVREMYPPELLNRLDDQIVFNSLSPESIQNILSLRISELCQHLATQFPSNPIRLTVETGARDWIANSGYSPLWGAREIGRIVNKEIRQRLAGCLLKGTVREGDSVRVRLNAEGSGLEIVEVHEPYSEDELDCVIEQKSKEHKEQKSASSGEEK